VEVGKTQNRIDDMTFRLYRRALHPELFHIYQRQQVRQRLYQAEMWITGLSHLITVHSKKGCVTELTTASGENLPETGLVTSFRFRGERDHDESIDGGLTHILSSQVERMSANVFEAFYQEMCRQAKRRGLFMDFEEWAGNGSLPPFSYMDYEARDRELHVHTYIAFSEECSLLKLQSIFEVGTRMPHW
jgi:hypothetical protein